VDYFLDIYSASLNKSGEELCGDTVKIGKTDSKTIIVLSDGLGSGVKANILATLTAEIIMTMLRADVPLNEVISTVIGTLPICKVRHIAYSTFTAIEVDHATNRFRIINFDNPAPFYLHHGKHRELVETEEIILDRKIHVSEGQLTSGDFLAIVSDGILHAGMGNQWNFGWGWENVAKYLEGLFLTTHLSASSITQGLVTRTHTLYGSNVGDDGTCIGIYTRQNHPLMIFTGPPLNNELDQTCIQRLLDFKGRRVVCGGTTGNIVADYLGEVIRTDLNTLTRDVPPIGELTGIDLVTEGIITLSHALDYLRACRGEELALPALRNGAVLLTRELLRADSIFFLVGQRINEFYQNPILPESLSLRRKLVEELARYLTEYRKDVKIEYV
jgi:hypothetical protein